MNHTIKFAVIDRFHHEALQYLRSKPGLSESAASEADALIIRSKVKVDASFLAAHPAAKFIVTATVGFDHIDLDACQSRGVAPAHCPDSHTHATAELTWALILACARKTGEADRAVRSGDWNREPLLGVELSGQTYGVVGLGRIGSKVAQIAQGFGMNVLAFDPYRDEDYFADRKATRVGLDELFHLATIISVHVPKTAETRSLIHRYRLELLRDESILVNTSRGGVVSEADLHEHFRAGGKGRVALDVFDSEPLSRESGLLTHPQILLSPHIGSNTDTAFKSASFEAAENLLRLLNNEAPTGPLPPPEAWFSATHSAGRSKNRT